MGDWLAGLFGGAPAAEDAPAPAPVDISEGATATPAVVEPTNPLLKLTAADIEDSPPEKVVEVLHAAVETTPDINTTLVETCCKRLRVLCREPDNCSKCDKAGTAPAVCAAMAALPSSATVQLQALAALVNLCSGEANEHRKNAVDAGAMKAIVTAMFNAPQNAEVQEMACIALQNCCYGEDKHAIVRRNAAAKEEAIKAVVSAMKAFEESAPMQEVGSATLRLIVHRVPELRVQALELGAPPEWVKPISQNSGTGMFSSRLNLGFGTTRRKKAAAGAGK